MRLLRALATVVAVLLAAFFAFVGWNKTFASLAELARYHAWTVYLPISLGRIVGISELLLAAGLLAALIAPGRKLARLCALLLIANQLVAAAVHAAHGEQGALPQNAVLIVLLGIVAWANGTEKSQLERNA